MAKAAKTATVAKTTEELQKDLATKQGELAESVRSHRSGELVNPRALGAIRKEIARIKTALRENELKESK